MNILFKPFRLLIFFSFIFGVYANSQANELEKGPITLGSVTAEVWGSYKIRHMIFPNEQWEFHIIVVPKNVRQGDLIEIAKELYSKHPKTRIRFFSDKQYIQQYIDRDIYVNDKSGRAKEVAFPNVNWVKNHLLGNINNRSEQYNRHWMLENRYGSMIELLP